MTVNPKFKALIPPLRPEELAQLEANLLADGCRDPLITWKGQLLDGHHRLEICTRRKLPFKTVEIDLLDEDAAMDWIDGNQLGRRNLTTDQASYIRGRRYNRMKGRAEDNLKRGTILPNGQNVRSENVSETLAALHGVSEKTIRRDGKRAEALDKLALTAPEQAKAVRDGKKRFNEVKREIKLTAVKEATKLPDAKYRVIYADPPWKYGDQLTEDYGPTKFYYATMTIAELCALPIKKISETDSVLFLWVTSPLLAECWPVIDAWGFTYKSSFVWDKVKHNMGHYNSVRHEFLLVCTRGSCLPDSKKLHDSVLSIERTKHSAKPKKFREIISDLYPHGKRIELFARGKTNGWDVYGNQCTD